MAANSKSLPSKHKAMHQALEQIVQDNDNSRTLPLFTRGPEIEITTMQDVEMLKAMLALNKIHIPTQTLERAIVMPRDLDNFHPAYPKISEALLINPYRKKAETKKKKGKKAADEDGGGRLLRGAKKGDNPLDNGGKLVMTDKKEYKVFEFGNYPLLDTGKPRGGQFRLFLPCDADWTGKEDEATILAKLAEKEEKKKGKKDKDKE